MGFKESPLRVVSSQPPLQSKKSTNNNQNSGDHSRPQKSIPHVVPLPPKPWRGREEAFTLCCSSREAGCRLKGRGSSTVPYSHAAHQAQPHSGKWSGLQSRSGAFTQQDACRRKFRAVSRVLRLFWLGFRRPNLPYNPSPVKSAALSDPRPSACERPPLLGESGA